jgi:hypothetical protein
VIKLTDIMYFSQLDYKLGMSMELLKTIHITLVLHCLVGEYLFVYLYSLKEYCKLGMSMEVRNEYGIIEDYSYNSCGTLSSR